MILLHVSKWAPWDINNNKKTQHTTETILNSNWWDEEMRYVHSPPSSPLIAHIIFPSCMTRASSQLIYAAFLLFVKVLRRSWKTPPPTTLIFFVCMYLSEFFFFFFRDGSSCCLLVVVKGDVDCKAMFNVVCVYHKYMKKLLPLHKH